jgi:hypothetical protein
VPWRLNRHVYYQAIFNIAKLLSLERRLYWTAEIMLLWCKEEGCDGNALGKREINTEF